MARLKRFTAKWKRFAVRKPDRGKESRAYPDSNEAEYAPDERFHETDHIEPNVKLVIPGRRSEAEASPESIRPVGVMVSGLRPSPGMTTHMIRTSEMLYQRASAAKPALSETNAPFLSLPRQAKKADAARAIRRRGR